MDMIHQAELGAGTVKTEVPVSTGDERSSLATVSDG